MIWFFVFFFSAWAFKNDSITGESEIEYGEKKKPDDPLYYTLWSLHRAEKVIGSILLYNRSLSPLDQVRKFCAIKSSPFKFMRGTAHLYFDDLRTAKLASKELTKFTADTWITGDMHSENYGAFDNAGDEIVYNLNDFDESVISDFQYDVWRFLVSLILEFRQMTNKTPSEVKPLLRTFLHAYLDEIAQYDKGLRRTSFDPQDVVEPLKIFLLKTKKEKTHKIMLDKWAPRDENGERRFNFKSNAKLGPPPDDVINLIKGKGLDEYYKSLTITAKEKIQFGELKVKHIGMRNLAGTGSLGLNRYYVLLEGPSPSQDEDIILDVKEQRRPAPYFFLGVRFMTRYTEHFGTLDAVRHNEGMLSLTKQTDPYLGYFRFPDKNTTFSVRHRSPYKETIALSDYDGENLLQLIRQYAVMAASAHANAADTNIPFENEMQQNKAPRGFAKKVSDLMKLVPHGMDQKVSTEDQSSAEAIEFIKTSIMLAEKYANRTVEDYTLYVNNFHAILDTNCTPAVNNEMNNTTVKPPTVCSSIPKEKCLAQHSGRCRVDKDGKCARRNAADASTGAESADNAADASTGADSADNAADASTGAESADMTL